MTGYACPALGGKLMRPKRRIIFPLIVCLALGAATRRRLGVWSSEASLWADAVRKTPTKPRPVMDYGRALEMAGDLDGAMRQFRSVIPLTFDARRGARANRFALAAAETNIAHLYLITGREATALKVLVSTLEWWPDFTYAHYNIGRLLWEHGSCEDGLKEIRFAQSQDSTLSLPGEPCGRP